MQRQQLKLVRSSSLRLAPSLSLAPSLDPSHTLALILTLLVLNLTLLVLTLLVLTLTLPLPLTLMTTLQPRNSPLCDPLLRLRHSEG